MNTINYCSYCKSTDHNLKNDDKEVICPILLNSVCYYCHKKGHVTKNCIGLKGKYDPNYRLKHQNDKNRTNMRNHDDNICINMRNKYGDFWPLLVENTNEDSPIANNIRRGNDASILRKDFRQFLNEKYRANWLYKSEFSCYDCSYLEHLRIQELQNDHEREMYKRRRIQTNESIHDNSLRNMMPSERNMMNDERYMSQYSGDQSLNDLAREWRASNKRKF